MMNTFPGAKGFSAVWIALGSAIALACGNSNPPPNTSSSAPGDDAAARTTEPAPSTARAPGPETASTAEGPPLQPQDAGTPAAKPVVVGEMKDECTPVGVDFEKRARPKLKECYAEGKKKKPTLEGTLKIKMTVDLKGKIKSVKIIEKSLPDPVAECMLKVVKTTPFPEVEKCWDATLTIPITFPTPR